jgi:hypothetical protein
VIGRHAEAAVAAVAAVVPGGAVAVVAVPAPCTWATVAWRVRSLN